MTILEQIRERAKNLESAKIVLPEYEDNRVLHAVYEIVKEGIAKIIFLGTEDDIKDAIASNLSGSDLNLLDKIEIFDYTSSANLNKLADIYKNIPSSISSNKSAIDYDTIKDTILGNKVYAAALLCRTKSADGFVAGTVYTSREVIKAAIHCLDKIESISRISSSFIIQVPDCEYQRDGFFVFSDCGVIEDPTPEQLSDITISSVKLLKSISKNVEPRVALLSFSSKGSGAGARVDKVRKTLGMVKEKLPGILIDGELQVDAALVKIVAQRKAPDSPIGGCANILIFPSLEAGNISYKLVQRLAKARAVGPILQGFNVPCSDLSRGCDVDDIIDAVAVTAIQSQKQ